MDKVTFNFTKSEYLKICDEAMLNDLQCELLEDKIKGLTLVQMSLKHNISIETVKREIKKIKNRLLKIF